MNRPNANRTQDLLTKTMEQSIPPLYAQEAKGDDVIVHAKFFLASFTWFLTELDPEEGTAFGKVESHLCPEGELGYFSILELQELTGPLGMAVERDIHFKPTKLGEI
jgi:hypothetical protein